MFNMRVDIVRKEMERRFKDVENIKNLVADVIGHKKIEDAVSVFLYSLLVEPITRDFLIGLSKYEEYFLSSDKYKRIIAEVVSSINIIISEIEKVNFAKLYEDKGRKFGDIIGSPDPSISSGQLSLTEYLQALKNINKHEDCITNGLRGIINDIYIIHEFAFENIDNWNNKLVQRSINCLISNRDKLEAHLKYEAEYNGAVSLSNLLCLFMRSRYLILSGLNPNSFGKNLTVNYINAEKIRSNPSLGSYYFEECRNVYHAVDKFLSTSQSKSVLINRLITYCTWIKRESFQQLKGTEKEKQISPIIEEFIFNSGYFPLVHFEMGKSKTGKSIPDILAMGTNSWQDSILIELKQHIGQKKNYSERELHDGIGQAQFYLSQVKGLKPDVADVVYLLVFYDGNEGLIYKESENSPKDVIVEFIYVGDIPPSKLKYRSLTYK
jgi:hypothetical protein